jgi:hypothetical protein
MWLERKSVLTRSGLCVVTQNWATLQTVEVRFVDDGSFHKVEWHNLDGRWDCPEWRYLGQGRRRWWWPLLPELLRKYVSAYSRP